MSDLRAAVERLPGFGLVPEKYRLGQGDDGLVHRAAVLALIDAAPPAPLDEDVAALVNAAHRMAKWTDTMEGEEGGAFVHAMREASQAKGDTFRALRPFGVAITDRPPARATTLAELPR